MAAAAQGTVQRNDSGSLQRARSCPHLKKGIAMAKVSKLAPKLYLKTPVCHSCSSRSKPATTAGIATPPSVPVVAAVPTVPAPQSPSASQPGLSSMPGSGSSSQLLSQSLPQSLSQSQPQSLQLWICLACAKLSCGSETMDHVRGHAIKREHHLVMNIDTFDCWCYACSSDIVGDARSNQVVFEARRVLEKHHRSLRQGSLVATSQSSSISSSLATSDSLLFASSSAATSLSAKRPKVPAAKIPGLTNLGNTCFFNSIMQSIAYTQNLYSFLPQDPATLYNALSATTPPTVSASSVEAGGGPVPDFAQVLNSFKLASDTPLTLELFRFLHSMRQDAASDSPRSINPRNLFGVISRQWSSYSSYRQQDSHELLRRLLDGIKEEQYDKDADGKVVSFLKSTFVDHVFGGRLASIVICDTCKHPSYSFEDFLDISLPITTKPTSERKATMRAFWSNMVGKSRSRLPSPIPGKQRDMLLPPPTVKVANGSGGNNDGSISSAESDNESRAGDGGSGRSILAKSLDRLGLSPRRGSPSQPPLQGLATIPAISVSGGGNATDGLTLPSTRMQQDDKPSDSEDGTALSVPASDASVVAAQFAVAPAASGIHTPPSAPGSPFSVLSKLFSSSQSRADDASAQPSAARSQQIALINALLRPLEPADLVPIMEHSRSKSFGSGSAASTGSSPSLTQCLVDFLSVEALDGPNCLQCDNCYKLQYGDDGDDDDKDAAQTDLTQQQPQQRDPPPNAQPIITATRNPAASLTESTPLSPSSSKPHTSSVQERSDLDSSTVANAGYGPLDGSSQSSSMSVSSSTIQSQDALVGIRASVPEDYVIVSSQQSIAPPVLELSREYLPTRTSSLPNSHAVPLARNSSSSIGSSSIDSSRSVGVVEHSSSVRSLRTSSSSLFDRLSVPGAAPRVAALASQASQPSTDGSDANASDGGSMSSVATQSDSESDVQELGLTIPVEAPKAVRPAATPSKPKKHPPCTSRAYKRFLLYRTPRTLVLHLKRFEQVGATGRTRKVDTFVPFEEFLDLDAAMAPPEVVEETPKPSAPKQELAPASDKEQRESSPFLPVDQSLQSLLPSSLPSASSGTPLAVPAVPSAASTVEAPASAPAAPAPATPRVGGRYRLYAVVVHSGSIFGGHYIAYVRVPSTSPVPQAASASSQDQPATWMHCSDSAVRDASLEEVLRCQAYILFYESIGE
ncbi:hypothetical protein BC831DRAFT_509974 [Entophlyctis helioformis]|nr:hypothetical protein BC831DRAFT_509974 [Entophlyctis helioformis]